MADGEILSTHINLYFPLSHFGKIFPTRDVKIDYYYFKKLIFNTLGKEKGWHFYSNQTLSDNVKHPTMRLQLFFWLALLLLLAACSGPQQLFQNPYPTAENRSILQQYFRPKEPIIQPGDKITVSIWGHEELSVGSVNSVFDSHEATGKWLIVDNDGELNLPQVGRVRVAGYDVKEVNYLLEEKYSHLLKDPIINVKVLNHFVTVLGEVNKPGKYQLSDEQVSLVEIIGDAEGLSPYARGEDVKVIRSANNGLVELSVDMTDLLTFSEYNVMLQPNDVVYIGANKKKGADEKLRRATAVSAILTGVAIALSIFLR